VLALLAAVAVFALVGPGDSELELSVDTCEIAADGSLGATGTIANRAGATDVTLEVRFLDADDGSSVDSDRVVVSLPGDAAERWRATGTAPDAVQQVTCEVTASE
jgi:hypothetical protein